MSNTDLIQMISLPLEIVGLVLTIFEVFFKKLVFIGNNQIKKVIIKAEKVWYSKYNGLIALLYSFCLLVLFVSAFFLEALWPNNSSSQIFFILKVLLSSVIIFIHSFFTFIKILPERPLLAFGITLSILGIAGEIYQFIQIVF